MGRKLFAALLVVAAVLALAPPLLGIVYERQLHSQLAAAPDNPYVTLTLEDYTRGAYSSEAMLRVALSEEYREMIAGAVAQPRGDESEQELAALREQAAVMSEWLAGDIRFDVTTTHGPLTFGRGPQLGWGTFSARLSPADGKLRELQDALGLEYLFYVDGNSGFAGGMRYRAGVPPFTHDDGEARITFTGLEMEGDANIRTGEFDVTGASEQLSVSAGDMRMDMNGLTLKGDGRPLSGAVYLGDSRFGLQELRVTGTAAGEPVNVRLQGFGADVSLAPAAAGGKLDFGFLYYLDAISGLPDGDLTDMKLGMRLRNLDANLLERYTQLSMDLGAATAEDLARMQGEIAALGAQLLRGSPGIDLDPVAFTMAGGRFDARLVMDFDGATLPGDFDAAKLAAEPALLLAGLRGTSSITAPRSMATDVAARFVASQLAASLPPDAGIGTAELDAIAAAQAAALVSGLVGQGMLTLEGDNVSVDLEYIDGSLAVNGMPIPLGGL